MIGEDNGSCHDARSRDGSVRGRGTWGSKAEASYAAEAALRAALEEAHEKAARQHQARQGLEKQRRRRAEAARAGGEWRCPAASLMRGLGRRMARALRSTGRCLDRPSDEEENL